MKDITIYLMEFFLVSILFFIAYLWLKDRSTPSLKRVFLLCWLISSSLFPFVTVDGFVYSVPELTYGNDTSEIPEQVATPMDLPNAITQNLPNNRVVVADSLYADSPSDQKTSTETFVSVIYLIVTGLLLARLLFGLAQIIVMKRKSQNRHINGHMVFELDQFGFTGASFFQWIFIGSDIDPEDVDLVLQHEMTHSRLGHSLDVMLGNLYQVFFWFNPLSWYLLKQIKLNTELETDFVLSKKVSIKRYGDLLLNLHQARISYVLNSFSSNHLKIRIKTMTKPITQKKWVQVLPIVLVFISFVFVSCSELIENKEVPNTELAVEQQLSEVKSITSKFISHQNDTHQKTGKVVSRVTFHPDGSLKEFVNLTSYPYDSDQEMKRTFWDEPLKRNLFHVMDGLSLDVAERNFLYGNNWSTAYLKYLRNGRKGELQFRFWNEQITADKEVQPSAIVIEKKSGHDPLSHINMPTTTEFFKYEGNKVIETSFMNEYNIDEQELASFVSEHEEAGDFVKQQIARARKESGKVREGIKYTYEEELLSSVSFKDAHGSLVNYKFYYENNLLVKQEYYKYGKLINSRVFHYKNGLKERSEIFNVYNQPEYTILYEYEFW